MVYSRWCWRTYSTVGIVVVAAGVQKMGFVSIVVSCVIHGPGIRVQQ